MQTTRAGDCTELDHTTADGTRLYAHAYDDGRIVLSIGRGATGYGVMLTPADAAVFRAAINPAPDAAEDEINRGDNARTHTTVNARQGGAVGIKDMLFDGFRRLAVRTAESGAEGLGCVYLSRDEATKVAKALTKKGVGE